MRNKNILSVPLLVLCLCVILATACKKKTETNVTPAFTVSAVTVPLQGGGDGLQFTAKCTTTEVKMTNVTIITPVSHQTYIYPLNGSTYGKDSGFQLQDTQVAYFKEPGTWQFAFTGSRTSDGQSFAENATLAVTVK